MADQDPEIEAFSKFVEAIEPWLGEVVLIGGWAHRLYRLDSRARKLGYGPLTNTRCQSGNFSCTENSHS
jgi:hypothetical protein